MVEFSRCPESLAIAAEIYENLETAVRAATQADRAALFDAGDRQMAKLDDSAKRRLRALRNARGFAVEAPPPAVKPGPGERKPTSIDAAAGP